VKSLIRSVARRLLPAVRFGWRHTPPGVQRVVRGPARRVRSALGLGEWDRARDAVVSAIEMTGITDWEN